MKIIIIMGFLAVVLMIVLLCLPDEVEEIDNSEWQIICANTGKPCVKDALYTYWDNCSDCPYSDSYEEE